MVHMLRRTVLGAAAALWNLSFSDQRFLYLDSRTEPEDHDEYSMNYPRSRIVGDDFSGAATMRHTAPHNSEILIAVYPHQHELPLSLEINTGNVSTGIALDIDGAETLATELLESIDEIHEWRDIHQVQINEKTDG